MMLHLPLQPALIGLGFGAAMAFVVALVSGSAIDASISNDPAADKPSQVETVEPEQDVDALVAEILERPLFSATRQQADAAPAAESVEAEKPPPQIAGRLSGVMVRPEAREAIFEQQGKKPVTVKEGQEIDGWTVVSIKPDSVVVRSTVGEQVLKPINANPRRPQLQVANRKPPVPAANKTQPNKSAQQTARPNVRNGR